MSALIRSCKGAVLGAIIAAAFVMTLAIVIDGYALFVSEVHPFKRGADLDKILSHLLLAGPMGLLVGGLGGFVARLPRQPFPFLASLAIVGAFAGIAWWLTARPANAVTEPTWFEQNQWGISIAASVLGAAFVLLISLVIARGAYDPPTANKDNLDSATPSGG